MQVRDVMNRDVKTINQNATEKQAAELMSRFSIGSLVVTADSRLVGIVTERDIMTKVVAVAKNSEQVLVKDIMTEDVLVIEPDADLEEAVTVMTEHRIKKLPVVSGNRLIGIITTMDVITASPSIIKQVSELLLLPRSKRAVAG